MKVSEHEISRQMKVRKTAVPNTIKKISKNKYFQGQQKNRPSVPFSKGGLKLLSQAVIVSTFKAITSPILEYANIIWSPIVSNTNIKKLQTIQNTALQIATGCT